MSINCLNLGCGNRFDPAWTNVDFVSTAKEVIAYDLNQGIPVSDASYDLVYHSHFLEHLPKTKAELFLRECFRVLRCQGVVRIVVPDLEQITRTYITALEQASYGSEEWAANYDWILMEMYDQTVRNYSGGEMAVYLSREHIPNEEFIVKRCGTGAMKMIESGRKKRENAQPTQASESQLKHLVKQIYRFFRYQNYRREVVLKSILGREYSALEIGRFRQSGEIHKWMYDSYSLSVLLKKCGFVKIVKRSASDSYIQDWISWNLDTEVDGSVYKPHSLYMEAIKPEI